MKRKPPIIKTRYKQSTIADKLGVTQPTVSNWLNLRAKPEGLQKKALNHSYPDILKRIEQEWKLRT